MSNEVEDDLNKASMEAKAMSNITTLATPPQKATPSMGAREELNMAKTQPPRNKADWHSHTQANVLRMEALTRQMFDQVNSNSAAEQAARKAVQEHAKQQRDKQRVKVTKKVKVHQEFISVTYKSMKEIDEALVLIDSAKQRLTAERYARFAGAQVSEYRLELRKKRPSGESFRDEVQHLLEKEHQALTKARKEMQDMEAEAQNMKEALQHDWEELAKDIGNRRMAMLKDRATVEAGEDVPLYTEGVSDKRSREICANAHVIAEKAAKLNKESETLVKRIKNEAALLNKQVEQCLKTKTKDLEHMKNSLAQQIVQSEGAIEKAQTQLKHMEQRAEMGDSSMIEGVTALKNLLRDLRANQQNSQRDLRNKTLALDIDQSVRKVTAQVATASMEKDKKPKLTNSASAPTMGTPKMSASGTAWKPGENCGNPQQGDYSEQRQSQNRKTRPIRSPSAGGSNSLKAAATATLAQ